MTTTTLPRSATRLVLGTLALGAGLAATPALAIDKFFPTFGNNGYDVQHYDLDLEVEPARNALTATARLTIKATKTLKSFDLDLAGLEVDRVAVEGDRALFSVQKDKLHVIPSRVIPDGRKFELVVRYHGHPKAIPDPTAPGDPDILPLGWLTYGDAIYVLSEPVGASTFFPVNDEPTDKASYSFAITVPKPFTAAANGVLTGIGDRGTARRFTFEQRQPMMSWLATVQINRFDVSRQTANGIPLRYYTTENTSAAEIEAIRETPSMLDFMGKKVGAYPFDSYGVVMVDDPELYYALETQTLSTFPAGAARTDILAHELAHQWFGDAVSVAQWKDLWLAEGFATYFEVLYPNRNDPDAFSDDMLAIYNYVASNKVGPAVVTRPEDIFADNTYYRGAMVLWALQLEVGERTFFEILNRWYKTYRGGNVTTADFVAMAVEVSRDGSVEKLLQSFIYDERVPALPGSVGDAAAGRAKVDPAALVARLKAYHRHAR